MKKKIVLLSMIILATSYSANIKDMESKVKKIEKQIQDKNKRIKNIDVEKEKLQNKISEIEKEIKIIENQREEILRNIKTVKKNIDYGNINLNVTSKELERKKLEFEAKIIAWNRYVRNDKKEVVGKPVLKKDFKELLYGDLDKMKHIKNIKQDIETVKKNIEKEELKLNQLRKQLAQNENEMAKKKNEQNSLIKKLNNEKNNHVKSISQLQKEKNRIEKEIKNIIISRTQTDKKITTQTQATTKVGKMQKPVVGNIVVNFGAKKQGTVTSNGIEIASTLGARVKSSAKGKVIYADKFQGLGKVVMIDYGYNMIGVYGNLISTKVRLNQQVNQGQDIGILGYSIDGKSHLYYELRFNLKPINPVNMF